MAAAGMLTGSSLITIPAAWVIDGPISLQLSFQTWAAIAYYAIVATAVAYLLYCRVLAMADGGNLMLCTLLVAPVAITFGAVVLHEALSIRAYVGFSLLAVGLIILDGRVLQSLQNRTRRT